MKKVIITIIISGIVFGSIGVLGVTYLYHANEVSYSPSNSNFNVDNVESAISELYEKTKDHIGIFYSIPFDTTISSSTYGTGKFILFNSGNGTHVSNTGNPSSGFTLSGDVEILKEIVPQSVSYGSYAFAAYIINVTGDFKISGVSSSYLQPYIAKLNDNYDIQIGQKITLNTDLSNWNTGEYIVLGGVAGGYRIYSGSQVTGGASIKTFLSTSLPSYSSPTIQSFLIRINNNQPWRLIIDTTSANYYACKIVKL